MNFILGIAQISGDTSFFENIKKIEYYSNKAKEQGIDLIVFPEMSMGIMDKHNTPHKMAKNYREFISSLEDIASRNKIDIICTAWEGVDEKAYNSVVFISKQGKYSCLYRKLHLFDSMGFKESCFVKMGNVPPLVMEYRGINISVSICYDLRFPEIYRYQATNNTTLSIVCSAWYAGKLKEEHLITLLKARAIENTMYVGCANLCGRNFTARSSIFDPFGIKLCEAKEGEDLIFCEIDKTRIKEVREKLPCLQHIRRDVFCV